MLKTWVQTSIPLSNAVSYATPNQYGIVDISPATIKWMQYALTRFVRFSGDMGLTAVNVGHVSSWLEYEAGRGVSPYTVNSYLRAAKTLFSRLQRNGIATDNPAQPIKPWPEPRPSPKAITKSDYHSLLTAVSNSRDRAIFSTFWATGCRLGGLLSMDINNIERWLENGRLQFALLVKEKGKNGKPKPRWCYSKGEEALALDSWLNERPTCRTASLFTTFTKTPRPMKQTAVSSMFRKARIAADIDGNDHHCNPHAFRHAFAIRQLEQTKDLPLVSAWLGHHSPEFTAKIYVIRHEYKLRAAYFSVEEA